jgi:hypothetical protein
MARYVRWRWRDDKKRRRASSSLPLSRKKEVRQLVDELAPEAERGRNLTRHLNTTVDGGFITTEYTYENVVVHVYGITRPAPAGDKV